VLTSSADVAPVVTRSSDITCPAAERKMEQGAGRERGREGAGKERGSEFGEDHEQTKKWRRSLSMHRANTNEDTRRDIAWRCVAPP